MIAQHSVVAKARKLRPNINNEWMNKIKKMNLVSEFSEETRARFGLTEAARIFIKNEIQEEYSRFRRIELPPAVEPDFKLISDLYEKLIFLIS